MPLQNILQGDYTLSNSYFQIKLPIDLEPMIPADDPVRLLSACVEGMDLSELYDTYDRIRKNQATPKQLFKIIVYANMNRLYSSRDIEKACRQNINYMYLLEGKPAPDHATGCCAAWGKSAQRRSSSMAPRSKPTRTDTRLSGKRL